MDQISIKARPFKTRVDDVEVEGFFFENEFVFRFYGLIELRAKIVRTEEDSLGKYAVLEESHLSAPDGFVLSIEPYFDPELEAQWVRDPQTE